MNMKLKDSKTFLNLAKAFAGECQASTRYKFIEYGARQQGYKALAEVIDKVVYQEFNHARMLYSFIITADEKGIDNIDICSGYPFKQTWDLIKNLKVAAEDEALEAQQIYPEYAKIAKEEGFDDIAGLFNNIAKIENCHMMLFEDLYTQLKDGTIYKKDKPVKWKCSGCGYEHTSKQAFEVCPVCQAKQGEALLILNDNA